MTLLCPALAASVLLLAACAHLPPAIEVDLATALIPCTFGGDGTIRRDGDGLVFEPGSPLTGGTFANELGDHGYEVELVAARLSGVDFFCGLTVPTTIGPLTLVLGGWGGAVCGLSCFDGLDAAQNDTRTLRHFATGRDYRVVLRVTKSDVQVAIDGEPFLTASLAGKTATLRQEVELTAPFGFCCYQTKARLRSLRYRLL